MTNAYKALRYEAIKRGFFVGLSALLIQVAMDLFDLADDAYYHHFELKHFLMAAAVTGVAINIAYLFFWGFCLRFTRFSFATANVSWIKNINIEKNKIIHLFQWEMFSVYFFCFFLMLLNVLFMCFLSEARNAFRNEFQFHLSDYCSVCTKVAFVWILSQFLILSPLAKNIMINKSAENEPKYISHLKGASFAFLILLLIYLCATVIPAWIILGTFFLILFPAALLRTTRELAMNKKQSQQLIRRAMFVASLVTAQNVLIDYFTFNSIKLGERLDLVSFYSPLFNHKINEAVLKQAVENASLYASDYQKLDAYLLKNTPSQNTAEFYDSVDFNSAITAEKGADALVKIADRIPTSKLTWDLFQSVDKKFAVLGTSWDEQSGESFFKTLLDSQISDIDQKTALLQKKSIRTAYLALITLRYHPSQDLIGDVKTLEASPDHQISVNAQITSALLAEIYKDPGHLRSFASNTAEPTVCNRDNASEYNLCIRLTTYYKRDFKKIAEMELKGWINPILNNSQTKN